MLSGFGIDKLGIWAIRKPVLATLVIVVVTIISALGLLRLGYSGANVDILRDGSQEFADYDELLDSFRNFNNDAIVLIRGDSLANVEGIETYRDLHFEFQFDERVESVLSIFSLVRYDIERGGWLSAMPARFETDAQVRDALNRLAADIPNSQSLFNPNGKSAVLVVYVKPDAVRDAEVRETVERFREIAANFESDNFQIDIAGQPAIRSDMIDSIVGDLLKLLPLAAIFCTIIAWVIFRSFVPVAICVAAPLISLIWLLGGMGLAGIDINFLTNILPVLIVVVVFADTLHLFIKWTRLTNVEDGVTQALHKTIEQIGPACVLSAITTAAALFSLVLSGNHGLTELGIVGGIAMLASMIAVIVVTPLALYWAARFGYSKPQRNVLRMAVLAQPASAILRYRGIVFIVGLVVVLAGIIAHFQIESRFRLVDYLSAQSNVAQSENFIDEAYPGSTPLFAIVRVDASRPLLDEINLERFYATLDAVGEVFPDSAYYSLADFRDEIEKGGGTITEADLDALPDYMTTRFISPARDKALVTIFSSANLEATEMRAMIRNLQDILAEKGLDEHVAITGYPVLASIVAPRLMDNLRLSLAAAIALSIVLIAIACRSLKYGLACFLPNLAPIVCVELVLWLAGVPLNMSITVALTVAFGLAVNDSIHFLNQYLNNISTQNPHKAMIGALRQVLPAMASTTLILVGGLSIMMASSLPVIALFSLVMILTLMFAIIFDVFQLPANILLLEKRHGTAADRKSVHLEKIR
jgi:uncharacterized protein